MKTAGLVSILVLAVVVPFLVAALPFVVGAAILWVLLPKK